MYRKYRTVVDIGKLREDLDQLDTDESRLNRVALWNTEWPGGRYSHINGAQMSQLLGYFETADTKLRALATVNGKIAKITRLDVVNIFEDISSAPVVDAPNGEQSLKLEALFDILDSMKVFQNSTVMDGPQNDKFLRELFQQKYNEIALRWSRVTKGGGSQTLMQNELMERHLSKLKHTTTRRIYYFGNKESDVFDESEEDNASAH